MTKKLEEQRRILKNLKKAVEDLAVAELEDAKKQGKPFEEIFALWLSDDIPKKDEGWLIHMHSGQSGDIWNYIQYGEASRGRRYSVHEIIKYLEECAEGIWANRILTKEQVLDFKKQLMEQNIGSTIFDW
jgi:hypothetical protein